MKRESNAKSVPQPVRFDAPEEKLIRQMARESGISLASVIRRCCAYALPKFTSGEINILNLKRSAKRK